MAIIYNPVQQRRDTAANWTANNPILLDGQIGFETDTNKFKFGDGSTAWSSLVYNPGVSSFNARTGAVVPATNDYTWAQINKAISNIADITTKSHTSLTDIGTNTHPTIDTFIASKGANSGLATLDSGGKVPAAQLPNSLLEYLGVWNAATNTPTLADGTGVAGSVYICTTAGTVNFGSGAITFALNDWVLYNGTIWEKSINSNAVVSVNGYTGVVSLTKSDVGLGLVENTALSTWAGTTNITTLGTISTGVWNATSIATTYTDAKVVSISGVTNRTTISGTTTVPIIDIASTYVGQSSITTLGIISTGTWQGTAIADGYISSSTSWNGAVTNLNYAALTAGYVPYKGTNLVNSPIYTDGISVNIGSTSLTYQFQITQNFGLANSTGATPYGIIYKGTSPFISDFNYGNNGTVTTDGANTFVGIGAGNLTMGSTATLAYQGSYNTAIGYGALTSNTTGNNNTANGAGALQSNTTGYQNTANGVSALYSNTTGYYNTANGVQALNSNTTGSNNTANGQNALFSNTTGSSNTANGVQALYSNTTGSSNTANGQNALYSNTTGSSNTANGLQALYSNTTGYQNTANGVQAGQFIADGATANQTSNNSVYEGYNSMALADGDTNEIVIGSNAVGNGSNTVTLGNTSITKTVLQGNVILGTIGNKLSIKEGTNASMGTATLAAGVVTVSNTLVTANSRIFVTINSPAGTVGSCYISARTAGTSFTITSTSVIDTSVVDWLIIEPN